MSEKDEMYHRMASNEYGEFSYIVNRDEIGCSPFSPDGGEHQKHENVKKFMFYIDDKEAIKRLKDFKILGSFNNMNFTVVKAMLKHTENDRIMLKNKSYELLSIRRVNKNHFDQNNENRIPKVEFSVLVFEDGRRKLHKVPVQSIEYHLEETVKISIIIEIGNIQNVSSVGVYFTMLSIYAMFHHEHLVKDDAVSEESDMNIKFKLFVPLSRQHDNTYVEKRKKLVIGEIYNISHSGLDDATKKHRLQSLTNFGVDATSVTLLQKNFRRFSESSKIDFEVVAPRIGEAKFYQKRKHLYHAFNI